MTVAKIVLSTRLNLLSFAKNINAQWHDYDDDDAK